MYILLVSFQYGPIYDELIREAEERAAMEEEKEGEEEEEVVESSEEVEANSETVHEE